MFTGRENELNSLNQKFISKDSQLIVMYGRRRIGKSALLKHFGKKKNFLYFEGIEGQETAFQIKSVLHDFSNQTSQPLYSKLTLDNWIEVFDLFSEYLEKQKKKTVIVFDELQWISCGQGKFVSLFKKYWDQNWKNQKVMIVLCGSVAHFMVKKVINSKALYGRFTGEMHITALVPSDSRKMLKRRSDFEVLEYLLIFGGIPKYLEEINQQMSFSSYVNLSCFTKNSYLQNEVEKIFFSQFKEARTYIKIIELLVERNLSLAEISKLTKIASGGGLQSYLENLELAGFVRSYSSLHQNGNRSRKYKLFDEYLNFYYKFIKPHKQLIAENTKQNLFGSLVERKWSSWLGIAFEVFCLKNAYYIAEKAGFADEVESFAPYFGPHDEKFQVDLIYKRKNNLWTICEIKYSEKQITTVVIPEVERKIQLISKTKKINIEKMLISPFGADKNLVNSEYFHHDVTIKDLF
jgi:AAA+ ATPase superfamily predicted ATPase